MQKTVNYQLNQWDAGDAVRRTDFNEDNAKIDAAIKAAEQRAAEAVAQAKETSANNVVAAKQEAANALAAYQSSNDAAVSALRDIVNADRVAVGSYMGDGTSGRTIQLPFAPKFALVLGQIHSNKRIVLLLQGQDFYIESSTWYSSPEYNMQLRDDTLVIQNQSFHNQKETTFYYVLFR